MCVTSHFFPTLDGVAAVGFHGLEGSGEVSLDDGDGPRPWRGGHRLRLDELHVSSADGMRFFVLVVAQERSARFRASVIRRKKLCFAARRQKNRDDDHQQGEQVRPLPAPLRLDARMQKLDDAMLASRGFGRQNVSSVKFFFACGGLSM